MQDIIMETKQQQEVADLEDAASSAFVSGSFQTALQLANQCLLDFPSNVDEGHCIVLETTLIHGESAVYRFMLHRKSSGPDPIDRVAAIILQSWFELSKLATSDAVLQQGQSYLQPFFTTYSHRPCSLELMLVLVQFLRAIGRTHDAMELASETLFHVFSEYNESMSYLKRDLLEIVRELLMFLFRNAPFCIDEKVVQQGLRRFSQPTWATMQDSIAWRVSSLQEPTSASVSACLSFLDNPPLHWPDECKEFMDECRTYLEGLPVDTTTASTAVTVNTNDTESSESRSSNHESSSSPHAMIPMTDVVREPSGRFAFLPTLGCDGSVNQWLRRVIHVVRVVVADPLLVEDEQRWPNRMKAALTVWSLWMAWRQRRRVKQAASNLLWKPVQEILEALVPRR